MISGLKLDNRALIRRHDFTEYTGPIKLTLDGEELVVPYKPSECQILEIP